MRDSTPTCEDDSGVLTRGVFRHRWFAYCFACGRRLGPDRVAYADAAADLEVHLSAVRQAREYGAQVIDLRGFDEAMTAAAVESMRRIGYRPADD